MKIKSYIKYAVRFLFLQIVLTSTSIFYFENYLISKSECAYCIEKSFRMQVDYYLLDDKARFLSFVDDRYVTLFSVLALFIFIFLVILYSTKFYTYVNELTFSLDRSYLDEYISIYLLWTSSLVVFLTLFRISGLVSRAYLILFTFLIPLILLLFRNSEFVSSLLGRSITNENYLVINLEEDSVFRKLRIATFRKKIKDIKNVDLNNPELVIKEIDSLNKIENINLIIMNIGEKNTIHEKLENYLINLNKKVLIISKDKVDFKNYFINRVENISNYYLTYFNNDIQYGSKYILKRVIDIFLSITALIIFLPIILLLSLYILYLDGGPVIVNQRRVGLHGEIFTMYKFRTMKKNAHEMRDELEEMNKNDEVIFKIENDPRIISGTQFIRNFSLDEIPQFINVIKGDMSIVGPRPLFDDDTQQFDTNYMRRLNVLPGITGLLQINERNTSEFEIWYKYDMEYIENWSLYLDLKIILLTPFSIFSKKIKGI